MKKAISFALAAILLTSCGVGVYNVSSGKADECRLSFSTNVKDLPITVTVDNETYDLKAVYNKAFKRDRNIKETSKNTIFLKPGKHHVKVTVHGNETYDKDLLISNGEHRIIEL